MSYLWQEFNIKTFEAETLVFRDGVFCDDLSDYKNISFNPGDNTVYITKTPKLPVHIIYIGEIAGNIDLNFDISAKNTNIITTFKIINKKPAFLNFFIKNAGENSILNGQIVAQNYDSLKIDVKCEHFCENTGIFVKTRVLAHKNSNTELIGCAKINKDINGCDSDVSFSVMADKDAKIVIKPTQYIKSIPNNASHSASLYKPNDNQINYLSCAGLSSKQVKDILEEAFLYTE